MAKAKGTLNRSTLVDRLVAAGKERSYLEAMPRDKLKAIYDQNFPVEYVATFKVVATTQKALPPKERTKIAKADAQPIYESCMASLAKLKGTYDLDNEAEVPERIADYGLKIFFTHDITEAGQVAQRCYDKFFMHLMWLLSEGKISGTGNQRYNEKRALKAESLARMLTAKGQHDNAAQQMVRAAEIRRKMAEFRAQKEVA
jgi:hypothetical protein